MSPMPMQWLIDIVSETWTRDHPNLVSIEPIPPESAYILLGNGTVWIGWLFENALNAHPRYVDAGNKAAPDFALGNFALDGNSHNLDLSGLVPPGTRCVNFHTRVRSTLVGKNIMFRNPDYAGEDNISRIVVQVANMLKGMDFQNSVDSSRELGYKGTAGGWNSVELTVKGWWL